MKKKMTSLRTSRDGRDAGSAQRRGGRTRRQGAAAKPAPRPRPSLALTGWALRSSQTRRRRPTGPARRRPPACQGRGDEEGREGSAVMHGGRPRGSGSGSVMGLARPLEHAGRCSIGQRISGSPPHRSSGRSLCRGCLRHRGGSGERRLGPAAPAKLARQRQPARAAGSPATSSACLSCHWWERSHAQRAARTERPWWLQRAVWGACKARSVQRRAASRAATAGGPRGACTCLRPMLAWPHGDASRSCILDEATGCTHACPSSVTPQGDDGGTVRLSAAVHGPPSPDPGCRMHCWRVGQGLRAAGTCLGSKCRPAAGRPSRRGVHS